MAQKVFSEKKMANVVTQSNEWFAEYKTSTQFKNLTASEQKNSEAIILTFSEWMYREELRSGKEWTGASVENVLTTVLPREMSNYSEVAGDLVAVLSSYFDFLTTVSNIKNGETLTRKLEKLPTDVSNEVKTEEAPKQEVKKEEPIKKSTPAKKVKSSSSEYSADEIQRFNRFVMGESITKINTNKAVPQTNNVSVGRNDLCPCGSGKKYKKCHGK